MSRLILIVSLTLLCFSLLQSTTASAESKTKDVDVTSKETTSDDQDIMVALMESMSKCNETFRIDMSYLEALNKSGSFPDETDRTPKCYIRCMLETMAVATEEGMYDPSRTAVVFANQRGNRNASDIEEIAAGCMDRMESCKCERAYQYMKCISETEIKRYESN